MNKKSSQPRNSNLELYRIILIILIIAHHYVVNSGLMEIAYYDGFNLRSVFILILGAWGKIGINCFLLITGYYMCKSKITLLKFIKLLAEVVFYNTVIYAIFVAFQYVPLNWESALNAITPIKSITTDFVSCYLIFYLCIPFLNILIQNLTKRQHLALLGILLFTYTILGSIYNFQIIFNYITWYTVIYLIGAFIRRYARPDSNKLVAVWPTLALASIILSIISVIILFKKSLLAGTHDAYFLIMDSNKILAVITSTALFLTFKNLRLKYHKYINLIASSTFGVLLIHANSDAMRWWLWNDTLQNVTEYFYGNIYIHALLSIIIVYICCVVIDQIRIHTIEKPFLHQVSKNLAKYQTKQVPNNK